MKAFLKNKLTEKHRWELPRVLLAAAECAPLAKTGGLADVVGTLPAYLNRMGFDCRVMIPYHRCIKEKYGDKVEVSAANCLGLCSINWEYSKAPYVKVDEEVVTEATVEKVLEIIDRKLG